MSDTKSEGQAESLVTSCPQCTSVVALPSIVSIDALLRCPLCNHKYRLRSVLPPTLPKMEIVVDGEDDSNDDDKIEDRIDAVETDSHSTLNTTDKLNVPEVLRRGAKRPRHRNRYEQPVIVEQPIATAGDAAVIQQQPFVTKRPAKFRLSKYRTTIEFMKVVIGGLLALPVAQLIIWWALATDPLGIAPTVGKAVPFLVPAKLREIETPAN